MAKSTGNNGGNKGGKSGGNSGGNKPLQSNPKLGGGTRAVNEGRILPSTKNPKKS